MNRLPLILMLALACSGPAGVPTLELGTSQSTLPRGGAITVRAVARTATSGIGQGTVRFESDLGSLVTPVTVTLDSFGSAEVEFTCNTADCAAAQRATLTARWLVNSAAISGTASVRLSGTATGGGSSGTGGGSATGGGSVANGLSLTGADAGFIMRGTALITNGTLTARVEDPSSISFVVTPANAGPGESWNLQFAVPQGQPFGVGAFSMSQRASFRDPGRSGLFLSGYGRACNTIAGSFEVIDYSTRDGGIAATTISFEQLCEEQPSNWVRGWVRYGH